MLEGVSASVKLPDSEFRRLSSFIYSECGINLTPAKKILVESRLQKRLSELKLSSFTEYCNYVMSPAGMKEELSHMIDAVSTNKTDFFREPVHFQFLESTILPDFIQKNSSRTFKVWSSACSSGEEPYTTAMVLEEFNSKFRMDYKITATDISTRILAKAVQAVYPERSIVDVPMSFRKKYLLRSKDKENQTVKIAGHLRSKVSFKRLNLIDASLDVDHDFDVIFCRNVLIYFDKRTQEQVVGTLLSHLRPGGYLFIGHSESIYQMKMPVEQIRPTIFRKL